jgi:hypothetical protein
MTRSLSSYLYTLGADNVLKNIIVLIFSTHEALFNWHFRTSLSINFILNNAMLCMIYTPRHKWILSGNEIFGR